MGSPDFGTLRQRWERPGRPRPIAILGAGSIVRDAHLPVYARLGLEVAGIYDVDPNAARDRAKEFGIPRVFPSLEAAIAESDALFDVAVPPDQIEGLVAALPEGAPVLIQKPLGRDLAQARRIARVCRERRLRAAVNFQLRFSPNMLALRDALARGWLGEVTDLEVRINVHTPWEYWDFVRGVERLEVLLHSIHYIDLIRSLLGEPHGVYCRGVGHPNLPDYADTRTSAILDYGERIRCSVVTNHAHAFGPKFQASQLKLEGTAGAAVAKLGVNLNYPEGEPDELWLTVADADWARLELRGSWFLEAFEGPISNLQRVASGEDPELLSPVEDALRTMAVVEACYISSAAGGTPIPAWE
jgi:predicted dehydrogenase